MRDTRDDAVDETEPIDSATTPNGVEPTAEAEPPAALPDANAEEPAAVPADEPTIAPETPVDASAETPEDPTASATTPETPAAEEPAVTPEPETAPTPEPDPRVPRVLIEGHIMEELYVELTDADIAELARKQTDMRAEISTVTALRTAKMKALKGKIDGLTGEIDEIDEIIRRGRDTREVRLTIVLLEEPLEKRWVDPSGKVIRRAELTDRERAKVLGHEQQQLPLAGSSKDTGAGPRLVKTERDDEFGEPAAASEPPSRALRADRLAMITGTGGEQLRMLVALGHLDPSPELVTAALDEIRKADAPVSVDTLVQSATQALEFAEPALAAWLEANPMLADAALKRAEAGDRTSGVPEIDEFAVEIRRERARLEAASLTAAAAPDGVPAPEPVPEGVTSIERGMGPYNVGLWIIVMPSTTLATGLRDVSLHLGGTSDYDEASDAVTIGCPVDPRRILSALRNEENPTDAVARALDADESLGEVQAYIAATFDGAADLESAIATHGPKVEEALKSESDGPLPFALAAGRLWLLAAERVLAVLKLGASAEEPVVTGVDLAKEGGDTTVVAVVDSEGQVVEEHKGEEAKEFLATTTAVPSRAMRDDVEHMLADGEHYDAYRAAHGAGILDPAEDDLRKARVECNPDTELDPQIVQALADCDAYELDLIRELDTSAKGRMALTRRTYPTKAPNVDRDIAAVRRARATLEVLEDWAANGAPKSPAEITAAVSADTDKKSKKKSSRKNAGAEAGA